MREGTTYLSVQISLLFLFFLKKKEKKTMEGRRRKQTRYLPVIESTRGAGLISLELGYQLFYDIIFLFFSLSEHSTIPFPVI